MKRIILLFAAFCLFSFANAETLSRTFYFDFGMNGSSRGEITTSPDANGHYWNNIGDQGIASNKPSQDYVYDLVDAANTATNVKVQLADTKFTANGMSGGGGLLSPNAELLGDLAVATATEDYLFASGSEHCTVGISGLDPAKGYQFKIFGSRVATDDRVSDYTFRGALAIQGSLQAAGTGIGANGENQNTSNVYLSPVMRPNAEGKITITVHRQYAGSGAYFPINCMRMQEFTNLHVADHEIYIDCGHNDGTNGELTTSPDDGGIYWNNLYENATSAAAVNLVYSDGTSVGANVTIVAAFSRNGYNNGGNTAASYSALLGAFGKKSVAGDYFFVNKGTAKMQFNGLNPDKAYVFYIYGSRAYNSSFGQTVDKLKLEGLTTITGTHHTGGNGMCYSGATNGWNEDAFTVMEPLFPDADGNILLTLSDERGSYQHINGIRIEEYSDYQKPTPPVEPTYAALYMRGTAVEGGEVPMYLRVPDGVTEGTSFEAFCQLTNGGTLSFETAENEVLSSGTCELTDGIYRIVYNTTSKTFTSLAINRVGLVGNVTSAGWSAAGDELTYQGDGIWSATLDLPAYTTGSDSERGQFCFNSSWTYTVKARNGVEGVVGFTPDQEDCEFTVDDIPMRHGNKVVTLNMRNFTYSIECVAETDNKITFFGSSVCNGQGAEEVEYVKHGYAWQYGQLLGTRHAADNTLPAYEYSNTSINGNNTLNLLERYKGHMLGDCGEYVVIGLGLGNEGIHGAANPQAIYDQWKTNMQTLIGLGEAAGKVMVATNNYPRGDYNATDYGYVKAMNLEMHEWNIPTANFLGALDNCEGNGQWASGYQNGDDVYHPTEAGHTEFMHTIVPSLFDALEADKAKPTRQTGEGKVLAANQKIVLTPEDQVHPFSLAFRVKNISALNLNWTLSAGTAPEVSSAISDAAWHTIFVSHYYAAGKTYVYIDGVQQSVTNGQMLLSKVEISGACTISDLHFWRSGMNADEVAAFESGTMLCSSLEIYCPLNDDNTANLAQSTNTIQLITEDEPVVPATYYIAGSGDAFGNWSPNAVALTDGEISFTNLAADWYEFKITDGAWSNNGGTEWGYTELDVASSSPMHKTYGSGNNICFRLQAAADVTVKMVNNQVVLLIDREYCITGMCGSWSPVTDYTLTQANNYTYTFYNLIGDHRFKVKERADGWNGDCTWGYDHLDTDHSNIGGDWDGDDHNIGFHFDAPADVTIALVNNQIRLNSKPVYFVTGDLGANGWTVADPDRRLDPENYSITFSNVAAGTYNFMLTNGTWNLKLNYTNVDKETSSNGIFNAGGDDQNIRISLDQTADVTVALDPVTSKITVTSSVGYFSCTKYSVVGWHLFTNDWDASDTETEMTDMGDGTYQYILQHKTLTAADYGYRVVGNHNWDVQYPISTVGEPRVSIPADGTYTIVFTFNHVDAAPSYALHNENEKEITISQYQFNTFYSDKAYALPEGLTAFIFTGVQNEMLVMESVNPIPANTGVVLYGAANQAYTLTQTTTDVTYPGNMLHGTLADETINNGLVHYILSLSDANEFGFFWPYNTTNGVGSFTNHAGKAYLELPGGSSSAPIHIRGFILTAPYVATGLEETMTNDQMVNGNCYDLLGRKVTNPQQGGVYIMNGQKIIIF